MKFEIKKFRSCRGMEGDAYSFDLHIDGKKSAEVIEEGNGGGLLIHWADSRQNSEIEKAVQAHVATLPPKSVAETWGENWRIEHDWLLKTNPDGLEHWELDTFLASLVDDFETQKALRRKCAKQTLFRLPSEKYSEGEYRVVKAPFDQRVKEFINKKYPGAVILNEEMQQQGGAR